MRIANVSEECITFDNGNTITFDYEEDRCNDVYNWADFSVLTPSVINYDYNFPSNLKFKAVNEAGFMFGCPGHWIFIPCYSDQNGYYTDYIDIYYCGNRVLSFAAEEKERY